MLHHCTTSAASLIARDRCAEAIAEAFTANPVTIYAACVAGLAFLAYLASRYI